MSAPFDWMSAPPDATSDPLAGLLYSANVTPTGTPAATVNRLTHLAALHNAGHFDPSAGPASSAIAGHVIQHALSGGSGLDASGVDLGSTPQPTPGAPTLAPSDMVMTPDQSLGSQAPGQSYMDQLGMGMANADIPAPSGYQSTGEQFLTALLGSTMKTMGGAQVKDMSDRQKLEDALKARTSDMNRRNLDLQDLGREVALRHGVKVGEMKTESGLRTAEDAAREAGGMVTIDSVLARSLGDPKLAGHKLPKGTVDSLIAAASAQRTASTRASATGEESGYSKAELAQVRIYTGRIEKMDAADQRDTSLLANPLLKKADRQPVYDRMAKRQRDRDAVEAQLKGVDDGVLARLGKGGKAVVAPAVPAAPTGPPVVIGRNGKPLPTVSSATGTIVEPSKNPNAKMFATPASVASRLPAAPAAASTLAQPSATAPIRITDGTRTATLQPGYPMPTGFRSL